jgi:DNA-binding response OmpR family regulator
VQASEPISLRRDTVLVVDDTPETLSLLTNTLDHAGFTVLIATDGEAALELLGQITPDLVVMDAVMPGISGLKRANG